MFLNNNKKKKSVSVTDLCDLMVCENIAVLKKDNKIKITNRSIRAGNKEHDRFHAQITKTKSDSRCFIATAVFGSEHLHTNQLRHFRDVYLIPYSIGRKLTHFYYLVSPPIARFLLGHPGIKKCVGFILKYTIQLVLSVSNYMRKN